VKVVRAELPRVMPFKLAAAESGFSYTSLRDAHFRGELAIIRVGRAWYVEIAELARFVEHHTERRMAS
jgi:hypothetical protein